MPEFVPIVQIEIVRPKSSQKGLDTPPMNVIGARNGIVGAKMALYSEIARSQSAIQAG